MNNIVRNLFPVDSALLERFQPVGGHVDKTRIMNRVSRGRFRGEKIAKGLRIRNLNLKIVLVVSTSEWRIFCNKLRFLEKKKR